MHIDVEKPLPAFILPAPRRAERAPWVERPLGFTNAVASLTPAQSDTNFSFLGGGRHEAFENLLGSPTWQNSVNAQVAVGDCQLPGLTSASHLQGCSGTALSKVAAVTAVTSVLTPDGNGANGDGAVGGPLDFLRAWPDDWDGEGAPRPAEAAIGRAEKLVEALKRADNLHVTDIDADVLGGVAVWVEGVKPGSAKAWISLMNEGGDSLMISRDGSISRLAWDSQAYASLPELLGGSSFGGA